MLQLPLLKTTSAKFIQMLREEDGGAMAEMAIGGVLVVLLITSIFDLGLYMILNMQLESGVRDGARYGITGDVPATGTREQEILDRVNERLLGIAKVTSTDVVANAYASFSDADSNTSPVSGYGEGNEIVRYVATLDWQLITPFVSQAFGSGGAIQIQSVVIVRNENF